MEFVLKNYIRNQNNQLYKLHYIISNCPVRVHLLSDYMGIYRNESIVLCLGEGVVEAGLVH